MGRSDVNELKLIEGSMCCSCAHLMSRTILPLDYDDFEMNREEMLLEDGTEAPIIHVMCVLANMDLDHLVLNCSRHEDKKEDPPKEDLDS